MYIAGEKTASELLSPSPEVTCSAGIAKVLVTLSSATPDGSGHGHDVNAGH